MTIDGAVFIVVLVITLALFSYALVRRIQYMLVGVPEWRFDQPVRRTAGFFWFVFGQRKLFKEKVGVIHFFIFWGFIVIAFGTLQIIAEGIHPGFAFPWTESYGFMFAKDVLSLIVEAGLVVLVYIRYVYRKSRLEPSGEAAIILGLIFFLILSEFFYSATSWALDYMPGRDGAFVSAALGSVFAGGSETALHVAGHILWWIHVVLLLTFIVYIPMSKHMHLIMCPVNEWFRNLKPRGAQIVALDLENEDIEEFGVSKVEGFTTKQIMDVYACAECGRCTDNCPANLSGKELSPKEVMTKLKDHLEERDRAARAAKKAAPEGSDAAGKVEQKQLIGDVFSPEEIWACTTCYSCQEQCPVQNEHINKIIDMRRSLVLDQGDFPAELQLALRNIEKNANPWGVGNQNRANWAKDLDVPLTGSAEPAEYLYWVGCSGAYDDRSQKVSKAIVTLLREAGVSFTILGKDEKCCGDPARRIGNEYLFQSLAQENVETLNALGVKKIIAQCPHCLNTLKNEYPQFGGEYEVIHYTQLFADLLAQGRIKLTPGAPVKIAYHDSCYLGRYQGEYAAPRKVLKAAGVSIVEADKNRTKSICCGAGGGRMWMDEEAEHRVNEMRTAQLLEKQPDAIGVNCPYCLTMMEDGLGTIGGHDTVKVYDLAEILVQRLASTPAAAAEAALAAEAAPVVAEPVAAPEPAEHVAKADAEASEASATTDIEA